MSLVRFTLGLILIGSMIHVLDRCGLSPAIGQEKPEPEATELPRVLPVFEPGAHVRPITAMGFTKDGRQLVTVGEDITVQVWNTATGQRVDLLRLPGYGSEQGNSASFWAAGAITADARRVAIGGQAMAFASEKGGKKALVRIMLVDVAARTVYPVPFRGHSQLSVRKMVFSPDGETLAMALDNNKLKQLLLINNLTQGIKKKTLEAQLTSAVTTSHTQAITQLAFSPDGKRLVVSSDDNNMSLWDVTDDGAGVKLAHDIPGKGIARSLAWTLDGKQFLRGESTLDFYNLDGTRARSMPKITEIQGKGQIWHIRPLDENRLLLVARQPDVLPRALSSLSILDLATGKAQRIASQEDQRVGFLLGAVSPDGKQIACTNKSSTEALIFRDDGSGKSKPVLCGNPSPIPFQVGWSKNPAQPAFAWSGVRPNHQLPPSSKSLDQGFDLVRIQPLDSISPDDYQPALRTIGEWSLEARARKSKEGAIRSELVHSRKSEMKTFPTPYLLAYSQVPQRDNPPLIAYAGWMHLALTALFLTDADGKFISHLQPHSTVVTSLAVSPDGRFLLTSTGTLQLNLHSIEAAVAKKPSLLLTYVQFNGEWAIWTPEGYYAASPGGEKLFGWAVTNGPRELATFHPAERFAKHFRRPDVIRLAIEKGSVRAALEALNTKPPEVDSILPPQAKLDLLEQRGATVKVRAQASSTTRDKPILAMRVLLDGRPLANDRGVWVPQADKPAETIVEVEIPPGPHELLVLARNEDGPTVSEPLRLLGPKAAGKQPTLHRICVGINEYDVPGLRLGAAASDAKAIFAALETTCVGPNNLFGKAEGTLILDREATRARVLKALVEVRKNAAPGDLVVFFFAGHGKRQKGNYFLLTHESDDSRDMTGSALSGDDLRKVLKEIECPVLLLLDACESANAVLSFQLATDDLRRDLGDDRAGVTILGAALAQEEAKATSQHGYFTAALLKGLKVGEGIPFDRYERMLYVHHLFDVALSEVREATRKQKKMQNPFIHIPWTAPPLAVRAVPTGGQ